jgi:hypothetical protein
MKPLLTVYFLFFITILFAQKLPQPPKTDAIGKESLWESFETKDAYDILVRTKKIAILPATSAYFAKKIDAETTKALETDLTETSREMQKSYYTTLLTCRLSAIIQNIEETNRILNQKGLGSAELLYKTPKNTICAILGVDAVMFVDLTMEHLKSKLARVALNSLGTTAWGGSLIDAASDEITIGLRLYEKATGDFFWANRSSAKVNNQNTVEAAYQKAWMSSFISLPFVIK